MLRCVSVSLIFQVCLGFFLFPCLATIGLATLHVHSPPSFPLVVKNAQLLMVILLDNRCGGSIGQARM